MMTTSSNDDARDRFCAELSRRLASLPDDQALLAGRCEPWWPFPDSMRRSSLGAGPPPVKRHSDTSLHSAATRSWRPVPRSLSAQDMWLDANKESEGNFLNSKERNRLPPPREGGAALPKEYERHFQERGRQGVHQQPQHKKRSQQVRNSRGKPLGKAAERQRAAQPEGTVYPAFNNDIFGRREALPQMQRRSSLLSQDLRPDEIVEEGEAEEQMEGLIMANEWPKLVTGKTQSPAEENMRRDSGYESNPAHSPGPPRGDRRPSQYLERAGAVDYFSQQQFMW